MNINEVFNTIERTSSNSDKSAIMAQNMNDTIKLIYADCYDKQRNYGVKKFVMPKTSGNKTVDKNYDEFHSLLDQLNAREVTGNAAIEMVENTIAQYTTEAQLILKAILDRKLTIGLSKSSFDKLLGDEAESDFEVTLAYDMNKVKGVDVLDGTYLASRKCDGARCVAFCNVKNGKVDIEFKSRQGKPFTTLENVKPALAKLANKLEDGKYVFDGECCIVDENGDEHFDWIMKEIRRKDHTIANPCYQIFDFVTLEQFEMKEESAIFTERYNFLVDLFKGIKDSAIKLLAQETINSQEDFDRWAKMVEDGGWEGFMLRRNTVFEVGRTKNLLKVKKFQDDEFIVKDIEIDTMTTSIPGKGNMKFDGVKSLIIEFKGNPVNVGSGLSRDQRIDWMKNPNKIIGKTICVKYFSESYSEKTKNYSLRFPILKYVYDDGRDC